MRKQGASKDIPCTTYADELLRKLVTPIFSSPDTCFIYWVPACIYAKLWCEKERFAGKRGATRIFLRACHLEESVDWKLDKWYRIVSSLITGALRLRDDILQPVGGSRVVLTLRTASKEIIRDSQEKATLKWKCQIRDRKITLHLHLANNFLRFWGSCLTGKLWRAFCH